MGRVIVLDILGAGFLVRAHNEPDIFRQRDAQLPDAAHGKKRRHKGPLIVIRTPAINQVAVPHQAIGIRIPAIPRADYIQVRQNVQAVPMLVQIGGSHIPCVVFRPEAPAPRQLQSPVQRHSGAFAKWHPRLCLRAGGLRRNQRRKRFYQLILPSVHPVSDFFFHSHDLLLLFFLHYSVFDKKCNDIPRNSL